MNRIVVLGEPGRVGGFRLAGVNVMEAAGSGELDAAWEALPPDTSLLILTAAAAEQLGPRLEERRWLVWVEMPE